VRVGLVGREAVEAAAIEMRDRMAGQGHKVDRFIVQAMASPGVEMLVGMVHDRSFGPVIACGAGGTSVELLKDVNVRVAPLGARDAADMIRSLKTFPLLDGYRGQPKADVAGLKSVVLRLSALVEACPEIVEVDLNPVIVGPGGATIVDARIRVAPVAPPLPLAALRR
jgi:acyl-CoA synthetase (NDP forming)